MKICKRTIQQQRGKNAQLNQQIMRIMKEAGKMGGGVEKRKYDFIHVNKSQYGVGAPEELMLTRAKNYFNVI